MWRELETELWMPFRATAPVPGPTRDMGTVFLIGTITRAGYEQASIHLGASIFAGYISLWCPTFEIRSHPGFIQ